MPAIRSSAASTATSVRVASAAGGGSSRSAAQPAPSRRWRGSPARNPAPIATSSRPMPAMHAASSSTFSPRDLVAATPADASTICSSSNAVLIDCQHHVRRLDHRGHRAALGQPQLVDRLDRDRRDHALAVHIDHHVGDRLAAPDADDRACQPVAGTQLHVNLLTNSRAVSATSRQPLSIVSAWPRPLISTISVTPLFFFCFLKEAFAIAQGTV